MACRGIFCPGGSLQQRGQRPPGPAPMVQTLNDAKARRFARHGLVWAWLVTKRPFKAFRLVWGRKNIYASIHPHPRSAIAVARRALSAVKRRQGADLVGPSEDRVQIKSFTTKSPWLHKASKNGFPLDRAGPCRFGLLI